MRSQGFLSLAVRNLIFTVLQPGVVAGLIPYYLARDDFRTAFRQAFVFHHYAGLSLFVTGAVILLNCITRFAVEGRGTLSPADPTKRLVVSGLYRISRNPMYAGVMMMLCGEAVFAGSADLWVYSAFVFALFNLFILLVEEPRLRSAFGSDYVDYCQKVRRWL